MGVYVHITCVCTYIHICVYIYIYIYIHAYITQRSSQGFEAVGLESHAGGCRTTAPPTGRRCDLVLPSPASSKRRAGTRPAAVASEVPRSKLTADFYINFDSKLMAGTRPAARPRSESTADFVWTLK